MCDSYFSKLIWCNFCDVLLSKQTLYEIYFTEFNLVKFGNLPGIKSYTLCWIIY